MLVLTVLKQKIKLLCFPSDNIEDLKIISKRKEDSFKLRFQEKELKRTVPKMSAKQNLDNMGREDRMLYDVCLAAEVH